MNCSRFETLLSDFMDGALDRKVGAAMELHQQECSNCRKLLEEVRELRRELSEFPEIRVSESFVQQVLEKTSGVPVKYSVWRDLLLPAVKPFLTQRYAFATIMVFALISFAVNVMGPGFSASSYSLLSPKALMARAEEISDVVYVRWREFNDFKGRAGEEIKLLKEDLWGRLDYHLVTILFASYEDTVKEQSTVSEPPDQGSDDAAGTPREAPSEKSKENQDSPGNK